jgi:hypothetical protein
MVKSVHGYVAAEAHGYEISITGSELTGHDVEKILHPCIAEYREICKFTQSKR